MRARLAISIVNVTAALVETTATDQYDDQRRGARDDRSVNGPRGRSPEGTVGTAGEAGQGVRASVGPNGGRRPRRYGAVVRIRPSTEPTLRGPGSVSSSTSTPAWNRMIMSEPPNWK